jgi:hypothetical protein
MSDTGKQSPLGVNSMSGLLQNKGLWINKVGVGYMGTSHNIGSYSFGTLIQNTVLRLLTWAINDGYVRGVVNANTYQNLIYVGEYLDWYTVTNGAWGSFMNSYAIWTNNRDDVSTYTYTTSVNFPATGSYIFNYAADNSMTVTLDNVSIGPATTTFTSNDTASVSVVAGDHIIAMTITNTGGPAGGAVQIIKPVGGELWNSRSYLAGYSSGDATQPTGGIPGLGNSKPPTFTYTGDPNWGGASYTGQVASWGYLRLYPWQAWNEFNYNNMLATNGYYTDFLGSFMASAAFIGYSNQAITSLHNSIHFLEGTFSNQNDLISSDISGVTLAAPAFGQDLIALGKAIDLSKIQSFGLPSNLLATLKKNNALTPSLTLALISAGLSPSDITTVVNNVNVTTLQQQQTYAAFLIITGVDLQSICVSLNCSTKGLETLADLLDVKKLFPNSYQSLTVPMYNASPGPTNSKTYYPIYVGTGVNPALMSDTMDKLVGTIIPPGSPTVSPAPEPTSTPAVVDTTLPATDTNNQTITTGDAFGTTKGQSDSADESTRLKRLATYKQQQIRDIVSQSNIVQ